MLAENLIAEIEQSLYYTAMKGDTKTGLALLRLHYNAANQPQQGGIVELPPILEGEDDV